MKKYVLFCILISCVVFGGFAQVNYQWVKSVGDQALGESGYSVAADKHGYIYVTGKVGGGTVNFNSFGTLPVDLTSSGTNCYIAKYDSTGHCVWAKPLDPGAGSVCIGKLITLDAAGNIYIAGSFLGSVDFAPGSASTSYNSTNDNGGNPTLDAFVAKYNSTGSLVWARGFGGKSEDFITSIAVDPSDSILCVSGTFISDKAVFYNTIDTLFNSGGIDAFVAAFATSTGTHAWTNQIGGLGDDIVSDIDADTTYLVVTGAFQDSVHFFNNNSNQDTLYASGDPGSTNAFYGKYILTYGDYGWMNNIGGGSVTGNIFGTSIAFKDNNIYLTGVFDGDANFETVGSPNLVTLNAAGDRDVYIAKYDIGENLAWARSIGSVTGDGVVSSASLVVDNAQNIYMAGYFSGAMNFAPSGSTSTVPDTSNGGWDIYFSKFDGADGEIMWERKVGGIMEDSVVSIAIDDNNNIYLAGDYKDTVDFNPGAGFAIRSSLPTTENMFLAKYAQGFATIKGTVYYKDLNNNTDSLTNVSVGKKVRLYTQIQFDGNNALNLIAETEIDNLGKFEFTQIPDGQYLALALPGDYYSSVKHLIPSYYTYSINNDTAFLWEAAGLITAQSTAPASVANIYMVKGIALTGNATLGGVIMAEEGFFREVKPVAAGSVVVRKNPGHALVTSTETDEEGFYSFSNLQALTNDTCYRLYVNIVGLPMVSNYSPCPGQGDSIMNLNFVVDSASIDTVASIINSISQIKTLKTPLTIYPNPNNGFATIEFVITTPQFVRIEVYNLLGKKVADLLNENKQAGIVQYKYNAVDKGLKAGVYFLNISIGSEEITRKIVQMD